MILSHLSTPNWTAPRQTREPSLDLLPPPPTSTTPLAPYPPSTRAAQLASSNNPEPNSLNPWRAEGVPSEWTAPNWTKGKSMQETRVGEVDLRVGEAYWYLHQGNAEAVWTVEGVRCVPSCLSRARLRWLISPRPRIGSHIHPSDPRPLFPTSHANSSPYPLSTFLSRQQTMTKCRLCDRDPASLVTIDDELAGESPAWLCRGCFECLHGGEEEAQGKGIRIVPLLMEL